MKKGLIYFLFIFLIAISSFGMTACVKVIDPTDGGSNGELAYFSEDGKSYRVFGRGTVTDRDIVIPATYKGLPVTTIGDSAFEGESILSITIPNSVTTIGVEAFKGCTALGTVTFGSNVTTIGSYAFSRCRSLNNVTLPANLQTLGSGAFDQCESLSSIVIPNKIKTIESKSFYHCSNLASVTFGTAVEVIGADSFNTCVKLTTLVFKNNIEHIMERAFNDCEGLDSLTFGTKLNKIGLGAFYGARDLTYIHFEDTSTWYNTTNSDYTGGAAIDEARLTPEYDPTLDRHDPNNGFIYRSALLYQNGKYLYKK